MITSIVLFVYNRLEHTKKTVDALQKNILAQESQLFIFSDGPKNEFAIEKVAQVRNFIKTISGFVGVKIIEREKNLGLSRSIISGVTEIVNRFGKVIVLEDDLITSPYFLQYMNDALDLYEKEKDVISIHGYIYPVKKPLPETFFLKGADCLGWATWKRGWDLFEPDGQKLLAELEKNNLIHEFNFYNTYNFSGMLRRQISGQTDSWAIRWYASAFLANKLTLYPGKSLIQNIGGDGSGTHLGKQFFDRNIIKGSELKISKIAIEENLRAKKIVAKCLASTKLGWVKKIVNKIRKK